LGGSNQREEGAPGTGGMQDAHARQYIDLAISGHDTDRDSKAAGAPIAYIDPANGPAGSPVEFIDLTLSDLEKKLEVALAKRVRGHAEDGDSW
jgi:hypothetical protein